MDTSTIDTTLEGARARDAADPLARFRDRFNIPTRPDGRDVTYLCRNSLGLQPESAARFATEELEAWQTMAVAGHLGARRPWLAYHEFLANGTAALVGAGPIEVVTMNTLTVNLHLMMMSFYRPTPERHKILVERPTFPSDRYAVTSQIEFHGHDPAVSLLDVAPREGQSTIAMEDIEATIDRDGDSIALILLPGVNYYSGQVFDFARIASLGRAKGCVVGLDLAHGIANLPLRLYDWGVDFAVWCSHKYMNGGPGAVAGAFVHERHADAKGLPRLHGWWGHDKASRFEMGPRLRPYPRGRRLAAEQPPDSVDGADGRVAGDLRRGRHAGALREVPIPDGISRGAAARRTRRPDRRDHAGRTGEPRLPALASHPRRPRPGPRGVRGARVARRHLRLA